MPDSDILDAAVVGAGWAGLGVSHALKGAGLRHRVLERARIGETWRTQRWDSFRMNTANVHTVMPGDRYEGPDPEGVMTRDAFVALGSARYVSHKGERPMGITWKLETPMPAALFENFAALLAA